VVNLLLDPVNLDSVSHWWRQEGNLARIIPVDARWVPLHTWARPRVCN